MCAGQAHDLVGALRGHPRAVDVSGVLTELLPANAEAARASLRHAGLSRLRVDVADAGCTTAYASAAPADLVLLCGVFGNVPDAHVRRTIAKIGRASCRERV